MQLVPFTKWQFCFIDARIHLWRRWLQSLVILGDGARVTHGHVTSKGEDAWHLEHSTVSVTSAATGHAQTGTKMGLKMGVRTLLNA